MINKKKITLALFLLLVTTGNGHDFKCPCGYVPAGGYVAGTTEFRKLCVLLNDPGLKQNQQVQIELNLDSRSGSHSGGDRNILGPASSSSSSFPFFSKPKPGSFFAQSWQEIVLSKKVLGVSCCIAAVSYGVLYYEIKRAVWLLHDDSAWCNWKQEITLKSLQEIARGELAEELLQRIQTRYLNTKNPTDHIGPLNSFLEDYRTELCIFRRYFRLAKWINRCRVRRLFPVLNIDITAMKERIERLTYLKSVFFDWTTDYKTTRCLKDQS